MSTKISLVLGVLALVAPAGLFLGAADHPAPASKGRVLLLDNERILEGEIERDGEVYRIRRTVGETTLPAGNVLCLCQTMDEAFAFLKARANLRDPDERLRLARWCHAQGLREQAVAEVNAAAQLRPEHAPTQRLLASLQKSLSPAPAARPAQAAEAPEPVEAPSSAVDVTQESFGHFVTKVQPILMNACAGCHSSGRGGDFKLIRPFDSEVLGRKTLQQNLASVLAQVNVEQPQASPLLTRAVSVHGEMKEPPLRGRQAVAYRALEDWVRMTVAGTPQLRTTATSGQHSAVSGQPDRPEAATPVAAPTATAPEKTAPAAELKEQPAAPADPYDPVLYNRQVHPDKK